MEIQQTATTIKNQLKGSSTPEYTPAEALTTWFNLKGYIVDVEGRVYQERKLPNDLSMKSIVGCVDLNSVVIKENNYISFLFQPNDKFYTTAAVVIDDLDNKDSALFLEE